MGKLNVNGTEIQVYYPTCKFKSYILISISSTIASGLCNYAFGVCSFDPLLYRRIKYGSFWYDSKAVEREEYR